MTRETAVKIKNLLNWIATNIQNGRKITGTTSDGEERTICEVSMSFSESSKEELERLADEIEKEFL